MTDYDATTKTWFASRWPAIHARGRTRYVLIRGLGFGCAVFASNLIILGLAHSFLWLRNDVLAHPMEKIIFAFALCAMGCFMWTGHWNRNEEVFRELELSKDNPPQ